MNEQADKSLNVMKGKKSVSEEWRLKVLDRQPIASILLKYSVDKIQLIQIESGNFPIGILGGLRAMPFTEWFETESRWRFLQALNVSSEISAPLAIVLKVAVDVPCYWELFLERDVTDEGIFFEGVMTLATHNQLTMDTLKMEARFTEDLFRLSGTLLCVLDTQGHIIRYNDVFETLYEPIDKAQLKQCFPRFLFSENVESRLKHWAFGSRYHLGQVEGASFHFRMTVTSKNGVNRQIAWTVARDRDIDNHFLVMTGTDITDQELLQKELESANRNLLMRNEEIKEITRKQKGLFTILEQLRKETDNKGIFNHLSQALKSLVSFRNLFLFIKEGETEDAYEVFDTHRDFKESEKRFYFEEYRGVLGRVILNQKSYYSGKVKDDPNYIMHHPDVNSLAMIPIVSRFGLLGVLGADSASKDAFSEVEIEMLKLCAEHVGLYLEELRMRNLLKKQSFQLKDLHGLVTRMMQAGDRHRTARLLAAEHIIDHIAVFSVGSKGLELLAESSPNALERFGQPHAIALIEDTIQSRETRQVRIRSQQLHHFCVPIVHDDVCYGALYAIQFESFSGHQEEIHSILANQLAMIWRLEELMNTIRDEALIDPLTEIRNRRYIMNRIYEEQQRIERYGGSASIVMLDLTDFKMINDQYGHMVGDDALRSVATLLRQCIRETDEIGRLGGDEFVMLLPSTDRIHAEEMVERMKDLLAQTPVTDDALYVNGDFGIVTIPEDTEDVIQALKLADHEMYAQKRRVKEKK